MHELHLDDAERAALEHVARNYLTITAFADVPKREPSEPDPSPKTIARRALCKRIVTGSWQAQELSDEKIASAWCTVGEPYSTTCPRQELVDALRRFVTALPTAEEHRAGAARASGARSADA